MEWSLDFSLDAFSYILLFVFWLHCSVCRFLVAWPNLCPCGVLTTGLPVKLLSPLPTPQKTMNVIHSLSHLEIQI